MDEEQTIYVCIGNRRPVKVFTARRQWEEGDRFEFEGKTVEVVDVYDFPSGLQLQVTEV